MLRLVAILSSFVFIAHAAHAAEPSKPAKRQLLLELSPFLSFDGAGLPGPIGGGVGGEVVVAPNWNVGGMLGYAQLRRSDADVKQAQASDAGGEPIGTRMDAYSVIASARYYPRPSSHSWFFGGGAGASRGSAEYAAGKERVADEFSGGFLSCEGGYRWLWENGLSFRVTGRGHSDAFTKHDFEAVATAQGNDKARDDVKRRREATTSVVPSFHVGIGYAF